MDEVRQGLSRAKSGIRHVAYAIMSIVLAVSMFIAISTADGQAFAVTVSPQGGSGSWSASAQDDICVVGTSTIAQCFPDPNLAAKIAEITTGSANNTNDPFTQYKVNRTIQLDASNKSITNISPALSESTSAAIISVTSRRSTNLSIRIAPDSEPARRNSKRWISAITESAI